jgi:hypothetical protein
LRKLWIVGPATAAWVVLALSLPGARWLVPVGAVALMMPEFLRRVRAGSVPGAFRWAIAWAALLSATIIAVTQLWPERAAAGILGGEPYRSEMFDWIRTGSGRESEPRQFVPQHLLHIGAFTILSLVSGGALGLLLGAVLIGYMSYFVGSVAAAGGHPFLLVGAAWFPWSVIRVLSFVLLGVLAARPLALRTWWPYERSDLRWVALAAAGLCADLLLKTAAAPAYGRLLRGFVAPG